MSETPETDALYSEIMEFDCGVDSDLVAMRDLARRLERERDEARSEAMDYRDADARNHGVNPTPLPWERP